ncbi:sulfite exporter TauE/SafE family protein [Mucilaginibacter sp. KACC 22063]|uniref:sulfite exporter TauE/SafE family protein n=1 Tax=Mucilaginibacter sp. KACC 22063 TaxID=3025666 RepID=UPI0023662993|nr:sulfite exporter TauE/SafE family protein [Mucilaginibacter sp. KACC 22063]WDF54175.1 sulfite exporter TauE/SafE family protein [Mucilaginibacter sp. KACC 22063]
MHTIAYFASALIGISLGLIGGGGSIMTVPVLVYFFGTTPLLATSYSLFIVGSTSLVGAINNYRKGFVSIKTALLFGTSSIITVFLTRKFIIPLIPKQILVVGNFQLTSNILTMVLFAILMVFAASAMISNGSQRNKIEPGSKKLNVLKLLGYGVGIGLATGMLGAGGGFLLIPTLVLLVGLPMKEAVGTSLLIIALNSLIGFAGDIGHFNIDWLLLFRITAIAVAGIFVGSYIGKSIDGSKLKKGFGWFVLVMGIYIIVKELILKN